MVKLFHHYEQQLVSMRQAVRNFSDKHPNTAAALEIAQDTSTDPEVERLIQSVALLNAMSAQRLEEQQHIQAKAQLELRYPHYLRPIPSLSIAQFDTAAAPSNGISGLTHLPRGSTLTAGDCKFSTCYEVAIAPLAITEVRFVPATDVPPSISLPADATSTIRITIEPTTNTITLDAPPLDHLRAFIDCAPELRATLADAIFMRSPCTCLQADSRWTLLPASPFAMAGIPENEALLPLHPGDQSRRLLTEYFAFPEKFDFIDIDLKVLSRHCPPQCKRITLHIVLTDHDAKLRKLDENCLRLGCTPIINLFPRKSTTIRMDGRLGAYPVEPGRTNCEIYSIDSVALQASNGDGAGEILPFLGMQHATATMFWQPDNEEGPAITLVTRDQQAVKRENGKLAVSLTCSNGQLAGHLPHGQRNGDLTSVADGRSFPIRLLRKPTVPRQPETAPGDYRRLLASPRHHPELQDFLRLHAQGGINCILSITHRQDSAWLDLPSGPTHMPGTVTHIEIDESAFTQASVYSFGRVLHQYLASQTPTNRFCQLRLGQSFTSEAKQGGARLL